MDKDLLKRRVCIEIKREECLKEDTVFKKNDSEVTCYKTFQEGLNVEARYQATIMVGFPHGISREVVKETCAEVMNVFNRLYQEYGEQAVDRAIINKMLKKSKITEPCELVSVLKDYTTYVSTGRGGKYFYSTKPYDLLKGKVDGTGDMV